MLSKRPTEHLRTTPDPPAGNPPKSRRRSSWARRIAVELARPVLLASVVLAAAGLIVTCQSASTTAGDSGGDLASQVYVPVGEWDKYYAFLSGGQSGGVFVYGVPSGRLIRQIPVFEPRAGYGYANVPGTESYERLKATGGFWGDTHHPILSETGGNYDGMGSHSNRLFSSRV